MLGTATDGDPEEEEKRLTKETLQKLKRRQTQNHFETSTLKIIKLSKQNDAECFAGMKHRQHH